ncbi:hypothetical protein J3R30DRAFT_834805 [Lentinula aciculospora]|uniref:Uncharacterized protein n=1 Tax=Lentinula aciculospora TaxID=153920 RepID=A0A9W9AQB4_9AGAR|nr:hypothetical protein J3R30DRAFT_834805 [Lentinula aciculospora]
MARWNCLFKYTFVCVVLAQLAVASPFTRFSNSNLARSDDSEDLDDICIDCLSRIIIPAEGKKHKAHIGSVTLS